VTLNKYTHNGTKNKTNKGRRKNAESIHILVEFDLERLELLPGLVGEDDAELDMVYVHHKHAVHLRVSKTTETKQNKKRKEPSTASKHKRKGGKKTRCTWRPLPSAEFGSRRRRMAGFSL
jgi:hypothetical protein